MSLLIIPQPCNITKYGNVRNTLFLYNCKSTKCNNNYYLTFCMFSFEINESRLSDTRYCITTLW